MLQQQVSFHILLPALTIFLDFRIAIYGRLRRTYGEGENLKNAAQIRRQIASTLTDIASSAFSLRERSEPERIPCGIAAIDDLLLGGFPKGALTEVVGPESSGRTSTVLSLLANFTRNEQVCAWIDVADALDPESAAANGVDLERLLWVRCGKQHPSPSPASPESCQGPSRPGSESASPSRHMGGGSPHPRMEGHDMPKAIGAMLRAHGGLYDKQQRREKKAIGTPGMPNRPLTQRSEHREEQINSDRLPPRRGDNLAIIPRCSEPLPRRVPSQPSQERMPTNHSNAFGLKPRNAGNPWQAVDHALRAVDLLLQSGGFGVIVLDLGSTPAQIAWRIPLATWFRFRAACERTRASLVLLTQHPCARSSAELVVHMQTGSMEVQDTVMTGIRYHVATERSRFKENVVSIRKPPQSERPGSWRSGASWAQTG